MSTLAMHQLVATNGYYPLPDGSASFTLGMIQTYAGARPVFGAPDARGQVLQINQYPPLYSVLGGAFGGTGATNFALPNLDARAVVHGPPGRAAPGSLSMTCMIAAESWGEAPFVGAIGLFGGHRAPGGWLACDGAMLTIDQHRPLFQAIGTSFGGDGKTNFALPNLTGAAAVGTGNGVKLGDKVYGSVPGIGLNYLTCTTAGIYPRPDGDGSFPETDCYLGQVLASAAREIPRGWAACDGAVLPAAQYQALFSLIGHSYGGSGASFALPDLRGRMVVGGPPGTTGNAGMEMPMPVA